MRILWLLGLGFGCRNEIDKALEETTEASVLSDADGDGYSAEEDCNDSDASVFPGTEEICDGIDNNCDGVADEGVLTAYYADSDGDGFGSMLVMEEACELPVGYVANGSDCDDEDATVYPAAEEVCDGVDNDCDGSEDEDLGDFFYADVDGDGYGDLNNTTQSCELPAGYSLSSDDCDDQNSAIHPAAEEVCDGLDNNCNAIIDDDVVSGAPEWFRDTDGDGFGDPEMVSEACAQPEGFVADDRDCDDINSDVYPGAAEYCNGVDDDCDGSTDEDDALDTLTWYLDGDGDGAGDQTQTTQACTQPLGYLSDASDCDDNDDDVYPGAPENCNGVDDDCDGSIDEESSDLGVFYADLDGDGYGDASNTVTACAQPSGYVLNQSDCDDEDATVYPAGEEVCDGVDNDCDGAVDEQTASDALLWYEDNDGDGYGNLSSPMTACAQPSGYVADASDCNDNNDLIHVNGQEFCNGIDDNCDGVVDEDGYDGTLYYADSDNDGYGDGSQSLQYFDVVASIQVPHYMSLKGSIPQRLQHIAQITMAQTNKLDVHALICQGNSAVPFGNYRFPVFYWHDSTWFGLSRKPFAVFAHEQPDLRNWDHSALTRCAGAMYSSSWAVSTAIRDYPVASSKVHLVPFGANLPSQPTLTDLRKIRSQRKTLAQDQVCNLTFVAVNWKMKGLMVVLDLARWLENQGWTPRVSIIGCQPDIPLPTRLVRFAGFLDKSKPEDLRKLQQTLRESHFLIHPTSFECFGIAMVEAMSFGVPVIASNVMGIPTVVRSHHSGLLCPLERFVTQAGPFVLSLLRDWSRYIAVSHNAYHESLTRLSWSKSSAQVVDIVHNHLQTRQKSPPPISHSPKT